MHVHPGIVEICLCLKGNICYETTEGEYQVLPGRLFISKPDEPHRRCNNPKGMLLYRLLFSIPRRNVSILGLNKTESQLLAKGIAKFPFRLCPSSPRVRMAFERLFSLYDIEMRNSPMRRMSMKVAALELLLALLELPKLPGIGVEVNKELVIEENRTPHNWKNPVWRHADGSVAEW